MKYMYLARKDSFYHMISCSDDGRNIVTQETIFKFIYIPSMILYAWDNLVSNNHKVNCPFMIY